MTAQNTEIVAASAALEQALAPLAIEQQRVLMQFGQDKEAVDATSIRELRGKLRSKYQQLFK